MISENILTVKNASREAVKKSDIDQYVDRFDDGRKDESSTSMVVRWDGKENGDTFGTLYPLYSYSEKTQGDVSIEEKEKAPYKPVSFTKDVISDRYIRHKTSQMVQVIGELLEKWSKVETVDALGYISSVKDNLDQYSKYLDYKDENRALVGSLQLIFESDIWEKLESKHVKKISQEIKRFSDGNVEWESFDKFSQELFRAGISIFQNAE